MAAVAMQSELGARWALSKVFPSPIAPLGSTTPRGGLYYWQLFIPPASLRWAPSSFTTLPSSLGPGFIPSLGPAQKVPHCHPFSQSSVCEELACRALHP